MKRSEINKIMKDALEFIGEHKLCLPPFVTWSPEDWEDKGEENDELRRNMLGWDITDFGTGDYHKVGLLMITLRNGNMHNPKYPKPYCEKVLIQEEGQITPYHYHYKKMEDIINRGGGTLVIKVYNHNPDDTFADTDVMISSDGRNYPVPAGTELRVNPGESVCLLPGQYHKFWAEGGTVLITEVSKVNDDRVDNHFFEAPGRFPDIDEDEPPLHLLSMDYKEFATLG